VVGDDVLLCTETFFEAHRDRFAAIAPDLEVVLPRRSSRDEACRDPPRGCR
jgi:hypothetical protein